MIKFLLDLLTLYAKPLLRLIFILIIVLTPQIIKISQVDPSFHQFKAISSYLKVISLAKLIHYSYHPFPKLLIVKHVTLSNIPLPKTKFLIRMLIYSNLAAPKPPFFSPQRQYSFFLLLSAP